MIPHPHLGVQAHAVARARVGHPLLRLAEGQGVLGQHVHDNAAVGHAGGLLGVGAQHVLKHLHQHRRRAVEEHLPVLRARGHRAARRVHPLGKLRVLHQLLHGSALKLAKGHLPQVVQLNLPHAGKQNLRRLGGALHRAGEHQRHDRIVKILFQRFQLGAALVAQGQVAAAANVQPLQIARRQAVADQMQFIIFHVIISLSITLLLNSIP